MHSLLAAALLFTVATGSSGALQNDAAGDVSVPAAAATSPREATAPAKPAKSEAGEASRVEPVGRVHVDFTAADAADGWVADALEQKLQVELSRFARVGLVADRNAGFDVSVTGTLRGSKVHYVLHDARGFEIGTGEVVLEQGESPERLSYRLGDIVRPIVQSGGILDGLQASKAALARDAESSAAGGTRTHPGWLVACVALCALSWLAGLWLIGASAWKKPWLLWPLVGAGVVVFLRAPLSWILGTELGALVMHLAGGALWTGWVLVVGSAVIPTLPGIGRAEPSRLWPLLGLWFGALVSRLWRLVAFAPVMVTAVVVGRALGFPDIFLWGFLVPACNVGLVLWLMTLVRELVPVLDAHWVQREPSATNPWHVRLRRYVRGYLKRSGTELPTSLLENVLFLPSAQNTMRTFDGALAYGGGGRVARVVVSESLLELALGPLPEEEAALGELAPQELSDGWLAPREQETSARKLERRWRDRTFAQRSAFDKAGGPRRLGEAATALGWVVPSASDETIPLISNTEEDYAVVHSLLTEHYAAFETDDLDDEDEDVDPAQKDFLFGLLLRELGGLQRRDEFLSTFSLAFDSRRGSLPAFLGRVVDAARRWGQRTVGSVGAQFADAVCALQMGRDALLQTYGYLSTFAVEPLTVVADAPGLLRASREVVAHAAANPPVKTLPVTAKTVEPSATPQQGDASAAGEQSAGTRDGASLAVSTVENRESLAAGDEAGGETAASSEADSSAAFARENSDGAAFDESAHASASKPASVTRAPAPSKPVSDAPGADDDTARSEVLAADSAENTLSSPAQLIPVLTSSADDERRRWVRIVELAAFLPSPSPVTRTSRLRTVFAASALGAAILLLGAYVFQAVRYHPHYLERMRQLHERANEASSPEGGPHGGRP